MNITPGKWVVEGNHIVARDVNGEAFANNQHSIATLHGSDAEANARAIAEVQNLIADMKALIRCLGAWMDGHSDEITDDDKQAITDARETLKRIEG